MFPNRFFPGRMYPDRYFPVGTDVPPPSPGPAGAAEFGGGSLCGPAVYGQKSQGSLA